MLVSPEDTPNLPATTADTALEREPFSLTWLHAVDPRIFTPYTWENGRETTIRLRAADGSIRVNVYRHISHYRAGNEIELGDEAYTLKPDETEAGNHKVSQFKYKFDLAGQLTGFDPAAGLSKHMQGVISSLGGLVTIPGSTITASNYTIGQESSFVSDGTQWIDARTNAAVPALPQLTAARIALQ